MEIDLELTEKSAKNTQRWWKLTATIEHGMIGMIMIASIFIFNTVSVTDTELNNNCHSFRLITDTVTVNVTCLTLS